MRVAVFDLDGTLADTSADLIAAANATFAEAGLGEPLRADRDRSIAFAGGRAMLRAGFERLGRGDEEVARLYPRLLELYGAALDGSSTAAIFYGIFFGAIVLSGYNENFFLALSLHLRMLMLCGVIYVLFPRLERTGPAEITELPVRQEPWKESSK